MSDDKSNNSGIAPASAEEMELPVFEVDFNALAEVNVPDTPDDEKTPTEEKEAEEEGQTSQEPVATESLEVTEGKEEDKPTDTEDTSGGAAASEDNEKSTPFLAFAKALVEEGQLSNITEEDLKNVNSFKDIAGLVEKEIKSKEYADLNDRQKEMLHAMREGVPTDFMVKSMSAEDKLASITEEKLEGDENLQAHLYVNHLMNNGFSEEKAKLYLAQMKASGNLKDEATEALEAFKAAEVKRREKAIESAKAEKNKLKEAIDARKEILPGIPLSNSEREAIFKSITNLEADPETGQYIDSVIKLKNKNPQEFVVRLHYLANLGLFNDKPDLSKLTKVSKTEAIKEFEKSVSKGNNTFDSLGIKEEDDGNADVDNKLLDAIGELFPSGTV